MAMATTSTGSKMTRARTRRDLGMGAEGIELSGEAMALPERFSIITPKSPENGRGRQSPSGHMPPQNNASTIQLQLFPLNRRTTMGRRPNEGATFHVPRLKIRVFINRRENLARQDL